MVGESSFVKSIPVSKPSLGVDSPTDVPPFLVEATMQSCHCCSGASVGHLVDEGLPG